MSEQQRIEILLAQHPVQVAAQAGLDALRIIAQQLIPGVASDNPWLRQLDLGSTAEEIVLAAGSPQQLRRVPFLTSAVLPWNPKGMSELMGIRDTKRYKRFTAADRVAVGVGVATLLAGVLVLLLIHGIVASTIGICLLGISGIAFVSLAFLLVGESEDRDYRKGAL